jgi:hypothetical protein
MSMLDAALVKAFHVKEAQRFEFRLEAENAFNHPVFSDPNGSFGSTAFGQITGTKVGNRNVQLGFKYYFKRLAAEIGIPYRNLINLYLRDCVQNRRRPAFSWPAEANSIAPAS